MATKRKIDNPSPQPSLPSAEWLAEMMFIMERGETDEERGFVTDGFTWDEARRNRAKFILDIYRVAKIELDDAAGIKKTPFTYEEIFTQEQIDNGVKFEDYLLLITHETALDRAKKKIAIWIDWEHGHDLAPEGDSPRSRAMHQTYGTNAQGMKLTGDEWLALYKAKFPSMGFNLVFDLMRGFEGFERCILAVPWNGLMKKRSKKVLGRTDGQKSQIAKRPKQTRKKKSDKTAAPARRRSLKRPEKRGQKSGKSGQMA
jgi:hypothetical protein